MTRWTRIALLTLGALASGCANRYVTPAGGVPMAELADEDLQSFYAREPASPFPANLAVVRVQDGGYVTRTSEGYGHGRYSVVTTRDIESDEAFAEVASLPLVSGVAAVGRILLPPDTNTLRDLRTPAAKLRADLLLVYSVDTTFTVGGRSFGPVTMISLGLIPDKNAHVTATVAGALIDVRTGFIYGTAEATAREEQRANAWSTGAAVDTARMRAEEQAFDSFVDEFRGLWSNVLEVHAAAQPPAPARSTSADSWHRVGFDRPAPE